VTDISKRDAILALYEQTQAAVQIEDFRQAGQLLNELRTQIEGDDDFQELGVQARQLENELRLKAIDTAANARAAITAALELSLGYTPPVGIEIEKTDAYLKEIDRIVSDRVRVWEEETNRYLSAWQRTLLDAVQEQEYEQQTQKVTNRKLTLAHKLRASGIADLCEKLWARAEALMKDTNQLVAVDTLLDHYYRPALDIARSALESDTDNVQVIALKQKAEAEWERYRIGAQVLTSAVQAEEYSRSLKELEGLPADQAVPSYRFIPDDHGVLQARTEGYIAASEARRRIFEMAHDWAHSKALEYMDRAEGHLRKHELQSALDALAERQKIDAFLQSPDKADFSKLQTQVDEELRRSQEAERLLDQALEQLPGHPLEAWALYARAVDTYAWARKAADTLTAIVSQLRNLLSSRYRDAEDAFNKRDFARLKSTAEQTSDQFSKIDDPTLSPLIEDLKALNERATVHGNRLRAAKARLQDIERLAADDAQAALRQLDDLEREFHEVVTDVTDLPRIRGDARLRSDAAAERERLRKFVTNLNLPEARQAHADAQNAVERFPRDTQFKQIAEKLRLHLLFLEAQRDEANGLYQAALKNYHEVAENGDHEDAGSAGIRIDDVQALIRKSDDVKQKLADARRLVSSDPVEAYLRLQTLDIRNPDQRTERDQLMVKARNQAQIAISEHMRQARSLSENDPLPIKQIRDDLEVLGKLGLTDDQSRWHNEFGAQITAQEAQILTDEAFRVGSADQLNAAIARWEEAVRQADASNKVALGAKAKAQLNKARKQHVAMRRDLLLRQLQERTADDPDMIAESAGVETEIQQMQQLYSGDAELELWRAELAFALAANSFKSNRRREQFTRAANIAGSAQKMLAVQGAQELRSMARQIVETAPVGVRVATAMATIEQLYDEKQRSVAQLLEAQGHWHEDIEPLLTATDEFDVVRRWWDDLNERTAGKLRDQIGGEHIEAAQFSTLAMLLVLKPEDRAAQGVIDNLDTHTQRVRNDVQALIDRLATADNIAGDSGFQILANQRGQANERDQDLQAIRQLAQLYENDPERKGLMQSILNDVGNVQYRLKQAIDRLDGLQRAITEITNRLFIEQQTGDFTRSAEMIAAIRRDFPKHPATRAVEAERERREAERAALQAALDFIQGLIAAEQYDEALQVMDRIDRAVLETYDLDRDFEIADPKAPNRPVKRWNAILTLVRSRSEAGVVPRVVTFAEPFDDYSAGVGAITGSEPPARRAVDWEAAAQAIEADVADGAFTAARRRLVNAVVGPDGTHDASAVFVLILDGKWNDLHQRYPFTNGADSRHILPLLQVTEAIMKPPYIVTPTPAEISAAERDETKRYTLARRYADSRRGEEILRRLETERVPYYRNSLDEKARALARHIYESEQKWAHSWTQWETAIRDIALQFDQGGIHGRLSRQARKNLPAAIQQAYEAYAACRDACPSHTALDEMIDEKGQGGLFLYRQAVQRTGYRPAARSLMSDKALS